ncbi:hypothetical protein QM240_19140, partial [Acinetobacter baumannii]|nr:hypothetical protein [Acinetobacter baumannii]
MGARRQGEAGRLVEEHGIGFQHDGDGQALADFVATLKPGEGQLEGWRTRCAIFSQRVGDARVCAGQFADQLE